MKKIIIAVLLILFVCFLSLFIYEYYRPIPSYSKDGLINLLPDVKTIGYFVRKNGDLVTIGIREGSVYFYIFDQSKNSMMPVGNGITLDLETSKIEDKMAVSYEDVDENVYFEFESYLFTLSKDNKVEYYNYLPEYVFDDRVLNRGQYESKLKESIVNKYKSSGVLTLRLSKLDTSFYYHLFEVDGDSFYTVTIDSDLILTNKMGETDKLKSNIVKMSGVYFYEIDNILSVNKEYIVNDIPKVTLKYVCYKQFNFIGDGAFCRDNRLVMVSGRNNQTIETTIPNIYISGNKKMVVDGKYFVFITPENNLNLYKI